MQSAVRNIIRLAAKTGLGKDSRRFDPVVNGNSGVLAISATLTDKGQANRDEVVAAIFSYLSLLREKGVDKRYFDELAHVLDPISVTRPSPATWIMWSGRRIP